MAKNQHHDLTNETQTNCTSDEQVSQNYKLLLTTTRGELTDDIYEKQQSMVEKANSTFRELCKTLESEQTKLLELEERRKRLQEEMLLLKAEIEQEKESFNINIVQSVQEDLNRLNNNEEGFSALYTCLKNEDDTSVTARNADTKDIPITTTEEPTIQDHVQYIRSELQNVLSECISEQSN